MDLTVVPTSDAPDGDAMATFQIGGFSVDVAKHPYGPEGQRLQIVRIDVDYFDDDIPELRALLKRGSVLTQPAQTGFRSVDFALRGRGAAIDQRETANLTVREIARNLRGG